jgi:hypothetical protein
LLTIYFPTVAFLLTDCIALILYLNVLFHDQSFDFAKISWWAKIISLGLPVPCVAVIASFSLEGRAPGFGWDVCWIDGRVSHYWRFLGGKAIEWFSIVFVFLMYFWTSQRYDYHCANEWSEVGN